MSHKDGESSGRSRHLLRLGGREFLVIAAMPLGLAAVLLIMIWPQVSLAWARHEIRHREAAYGFATGTVAATASCPFTGMWGIVSVVPGGVFAGAGVRAGDVPAWAHGSAEELAFALHEVERGRVGEFAVFNCADPSGKGGRVIHIAPVRQPSR